MKHPKGPFGPFYFWLFLFNALPWAGLQLFHGLGLAYVANSL